MLTLMDKKADHNCQGYSRRDFLKVGGLGVGGMSLASMLQLKAEAAKAGIPVKDRAVVLLFLHGGPPHIELFDPKMTAPSEIRSITGEVKTSIKGVTFGGTFPKLAKLANKIAVVRSYGSKHSGHTYHKVASGFNSTKATMGSIYSRVAGINNPNTGMPNNVHVKPEAITTGLKLGSNFETSALPGVTDPGSLGPSYRAFDPSGGGPINENMKLRLEPKRLEDRKGLLKDLDRLRRAADVSGSLDSADTYQQQAFDIITGGVASAFDLSKEDPRVVERYNTKKLFDDKKLQRWGDMRRTTNLLGHQMLMARRLVESGCGFVTVSDCGWDYHANNNSPKNMAGIYPMGGQVDHAVSTFIEDCESRGLSDKILLVVTGEMGRSPRLDKNGGRGHYGELTSLLMWGGGLRMGQVIGQSDSQSSKPATTPYDPSHMFGTIMHSMFDIGELRLSQSVPKDMLDVVTNSKVIPELF
jgi:hypothetical protein